jgi:hypothetical protein
MLKIGEDAGNEHLVVVDEHELRRDIKDESKKRHSIDRSSSISSSRTHVRSESLDRFRVNKRPKIQPTQPCFLFNKSRNLCGFSNCKFAHACAVCGSKEHGWYACTYRSFCLDYSKGAGFCKRENCVRRHWCVVSPIHF